MSIFKSYTPRILYQHTLCMIRSIFVHPPKMELKPTSYFKAVLDAHTWIRNDLKAHLPEHSNQSENDHQPTIEQIHASLVDIELLLFGSKSDFPSTIEGCCLYTVHLKDKLQPKSSCELQ